MELKEIYEQITPDDFGRYLISEGWKVNDCLFRPLYSRVYKSKNGGNIHICRGNEWRGQFKKNNLFFYFWQNSGEVIDFESFKSEFAQKIMNTPIFFNPHKSEIKTSFRVGGNVDVYIHFRDELDTVLHVARVDCSAYPINENSTTRAAVVYMRRGLEAFMYALENKEGRLDYDDMFIFRRSDPIMELKVIEK